ncbi:hypothetical protein [Providencia rettgeri]|uniref:hypothetical protein n=1 Tax=Providencia rettgeri TaxID=587 RepID=UPI0034E07ED4
MIKKYKQPLLSLALISVLGGYASSSLSAVFNTINLNLSGTVDMTMSERETHQVSAVLTGNNSFTVKPVLANKVTPNGWNTTIPLIGISSEQNRCNVDAYVSRPSSIIGYGLPLTNHTTQKTEVYITPELNYELVITGVGKPFVPLYKGTFYSEPSSDLEGMPTRFVRNACFIPSNTFASVPAGGEKQLTVTSPSQHTIYVSKDLSPGSFAYSGTQPLYVISGGWDLSARGALELKITANLVVLRYCEVSGVTNTKIEHQFNSEMQNLQSSSLSVTCNGSRQDSLRMVALAKETTYDGAEPTKLLLQPTDDSVKSEVLPWVLGLIHKVGDTESLSCNDIGKSNLIHFDGREMDLGFKIEPNKPMALNIKWALCRTPEVKPGSYHGKTELSFFVKS